MVSSNLLEMQTLKRIASASRHLAKSLQDARTANPPQPPSRTIPSVLPLILPQPPTLLPDLLAIGLEKRLADSIAHVFLKAATRARSSFDAHFGKTWKLYFEIEAAVGIDYDKLGKLLAAAHAAKFSRMLDMWKAEIVNNFGPRFIHAQQSRRNPGTPKNRKCNLARRPFNHDAIPVLDEFFSHNAFPTRNQKEELAAKTHMNYRQVDVWFQNRRARAKKDGKRLKSGDSSASLPGDLEATLMNMLSTEHGDEKTSMGSEKDKSRSSTPQPCLSAPLDPPPPAHAFPTAYPPACSYIPFPVEGRDKLATPWMRNILPIHHQDQPSTTVAELARAFANLSLGDDDTSRGHSTPLEHTVPSDGTSAAAHIGFAVVAPRAPLGALRPASSSSLLRPRNPAPSILRSLPHQVEDSLTSRSAMSTSIVHKDYANAPPNLDAVDPAFLQGGSIAHRPPLPSCATTRPQPSAARRRRTPSQNAAFDTASDHRVSLQQPVSSNRRFAVLPRRASRPCPYPAVPSQAETSHSPYSRPISRSSSCSSFSSESSGSSDSESILLTPPLRPADASTDACAFPAGYNLRKSSPDLPTLDDPTLAKQYLSPFDAFRSPKYSSSAHHAF